MPEFVTEVETIFTNTTSPKTTESFDVVIGDYLVCIGIMNDNDEVINTPTNSGTPFTWTLQQFADGGAGRDRMYLWTAPVTATQSMTVSATQDTPTRQYGIMVYVIRNSAGIGNSVKVEPAANGAPTVNITTTRPNSLIVWASEDDTAVDGATRVYRENAGVAIERMYVFQSGNRTQYSAYHANAGPIGTYALGLSSPTGQDYTMVAVELIGPIVSINYMSGGLVE